MLLGKVQALTRMAVRYGSGMGGAEFTGRARVRERT